MIKQSFNSSLSLIMTGMKDCILIQSFCIRLSLSDTQQFIPETLTVRYDSYTRPGFQSLYRVPVAAEFQRNTATFGSRENVSFRQGGARFEIYAGDLMLIKGVLGKDEGDDDWKICCHCDLMKAAEISVTTEGRGRTEAISGKVVRMGKFKIGGRLEEIPEEREVVYGDAGEGECYWSDEECSMAAAEEEGGGNEEVEMEIEVLRLAMDMGIWVLCFGLGLSYFVTKASPSPSPNIFRKWLK